MAMHEFEALLFSDNNILANFLNIDIVASIISDGGEPEKINNSRETAPSKRLNTLKTNGKFKKTTEGISIAEQIGITRIRDKCPLFNEWVTSLEQLVKE